MERKDFRSDRTSSVDRSLGKQNNITFFFLFSFFLSYIPGKMFLSVFVLESVVTISVIFVMIKSLNSTFFISYHPKWNEKTFDLTEQVV